MKYVCLVYQREEDLLAFTDDELDEVMAECNEWVADMDKSGHHVICSALQSVRTAASLSYRNGELVVTDGPFAETKEFLGGFSIVEARDLNEAISLASRMPISRTGTVEVRPMLDLDVASADPLDSKLIAAFRRASHGAFTGISAGSLQVPSK